MEMIHKIRFGTEREVRLFGLPVCQYDRNPNHTYFSLFPKSFISKTLKQISREIGKDYDLVFLLRCNAIGENYLLNFLYKEVMMNKNAKKVCFVLHKNNAHCLPMLRLFTDVDIYITEVPLAKLNAVLEKKSYRYKNSEFITYHCPLSKITDYQSDNYCKHIQTLVGASSFEHIKLNFPQGIENCEKRLVGINLDKFVFINPEVKSLEALPEAFWTKLVEEVRKLGYDVFINTKNGSSTLGFSVNCSLVEAAYIASKAKAVITMRTGFSELISTVAQTMHVIYTPSIFDGKDVMNLFSLMEYPFVDKGAIHEYNASEEKLDTLLNDVLDSLK